MGHTWIIQNNLLILWSLILSTCTKPILPSNVTYSQVLKVQGWTPWGWEAFSAYH